MRFLLAVALLLASPALFAQSGVGDVTFANSGALAAQESFLRGLALLHNFEYADAADSFRAAQKIDPGFVMAYWGEAMTHTHPVWAQQDAAAARAVLQRLGSSAAERAAKASTPRERDYLHTLDVLYGDGTKEERDVKYAGAMAALHERYPADVDATAFYALSLLGTAAYKRDFATYMRSAALLEEVFPAHQHHPGVLHYLIHSYDDPVHAPLGMRAARLYGGVAPNAAHALHMTSHIYIALGMWDEVIDANRRAIAVVTRQRAAKSQPPASCGHYPSWLEYGLLQEQRFEEAEKTLDACRQSAMAAMQDKTVVNQYADMRIMSLTSGGKLDSAATPAGASAAAKFTLAYADALIAARRSDVPALNDAAVRVRGLNKELGGATDDHPMMMTRSQHERPGVILQQVEALELIAAGKRAEGIAVLQKAAAAEQAMPLEFGPPVVEKPSLELLAEELLEAGRTAEAEQAYRSTLARTPGRTRALEGLLKAQKALGENDAAARTAELLQRNTKRAAPVAGGQ